MNKNSKSNRLINEKSPYLLQHAYNPVDWYPWCEEAFLKAKQENKPIFLSIGYSSCHWCHVMEKESFEDEEVAKILNDKYISIKVDREERPDVDNTYMTFCQAVTGSGGWPLTIIMTPEQKPFFAGTYFPKKSMYGRPGIIQILKQISDEWKNNKDKIINTSNKLLNTMKERVSQDKSEEINGSILHDAIMEMNYYYDNKYGGFGIAPKFPTPHKLMLLLIYYKVYNDKSALGMVENTLKCMYKGGIFDHIGFGFSRYSTDEKWLVPHFEKMLYDNALLAYVYTEAYQVTGKSFYKEVAEKIFTYILRDMTSPEGGFYSAEDADSEGVEGKFYVWSLEEIQSILGEDAKEFCNTYDITEKGNFEGKNIPNLIGKDLENIDKLEELRNKLFKVREKRVHPFKDDKILTAWNALMIVSLSYAGRVFENKEYINRAKKAYDFIENNLIRKDGRLLARFRHGEAAYIAYLEDYSFLVWALMELYEATFESNYLKQALNFTDKMIKLFWDEESYGFFHSGRDGEKLILNLKDSYDTAIPSGNSVTAMNLIKLSKITGDNSLGEKAYKMFQGFGGNIKESLQSHSIFLISYMNYIKPSRQIVIASEKEDRLFKEMIKKVNKRFMPFTIILLNDGNLENIVPFIKDEKKIDNKTTAYICENFSCNKPVYNIEDFIKLIN
ncbi:thioredoxin domain-containing protein [Clostridium botulinum C]|uniref:Thioredoxin domain-containing protein n=2 Tax=Clostridium botulinum TaxID=1491 RepID=A0A9Q4TGR2_CLOBO|nr:thioredoxin domain-containing protein [Clostridium botulinum]MCD3194571.1 thioredoxin domain-containing protein [Clostridium botulinum C]MCD3199725.1 thioredoxin domain-containing protein [Clostridium botulinum C]MCD3205200.1 thioredoxin domain-containing protein [Clostridium botulinum C]MCD3209124.1 thioredoxin domain-containing protein [Clostridium botulinum C]MCD3225483.1 thioredoxin domain-containing protein [Clostridium botulinum C]